MERSESESEWVGVYNPDEPTIPGSYVFDANIGRFRLIRLAMAASMMLDAADPATERD